MDPDDHKTNALLLAAALGVVLNEDEGVVVHHEGKGYMVSLFHDEKDDTWHVTVDNDDDLLKYPHLQMTLVHDPDEETESQPEVEEPKETLQ